MKKVTENDIVTTGYALWIDEDKYAGPKHKRVLVIKHGEFRKIHAKNGDLYILEGREGKGFYGWVRSNQIELYNEITHGNTKS